MVDREPGHVGARSVAPGTGGWRGDGGAGRLRGRPRPAARGRGLLVYAPVVLIAVAGFVVGGPARYRRLDFILGGCVIARLLVVAGLGDHWWAGHAYGLRYI